MQNSDSSIPETSAWTELGRRVRVEEVGVVEGVGGVGGRQANVPRFCGPAEGYWCAGVNQGA